MKSKPTLVAVALITFIAGVAFTRLILHRLASESSTAIPALELKDPNSCVEAETSPELSTFFAEFREALKTKDTHKLFTMTRRCNFVWFGEAALAHPLEHDVRPVPTELETPFDVRPIMSLQWGDRLVFPSEFDFALNTDVVFSPQITRQVLRDNPQRSTECEYAISWREQVLNHFCFERTSSGFKFIGLRIEP